MAEPAGALDASESALELSTIHKDHAVLCPIDLSPQVSFVESKVSAVRGNDDAVSRLTEQRWQTHSGRRHAPSVTASGSKAPDADSSPSVRRSSPSLVRP